jgi:type IV secretion system protein VirD4
MRAMKNYAGHRLSPWLGHLMVSRQETARPLLTPGEVMQLPPDEALVQVSGVPPIRATKVRYFLDPELAGRVADPPTVLKPLRVGASSDWAATIAVAGGVGKGSDATADEGGHRIEPEFEAPAESVPETPAPEAWLEFEQDSDESVQAEQNRRFRAAARQASLDPDDGIPL